jgi:hypothetical protein
MRPPVREFLPLRRVRDPPEICAIRSRGEDVHLVRAGQIQREHDALAVGRPAWLEIEVTTNASVQPDRMSNGAVRVNPVSA